MRFCHISFDLLHQLPLVATCIVALINGAILYINRLVAVSAPNHSIKVIYMFSAKFLVLFLAFVTSDVVAHGKRKCPPKIQVTEALVDNGLADKKPMIKTMNPSPAPTNPPAASLSTPPSPPSPPSPDPAPATPAKTLVGDTSLQIAFKQTLEGVQRVIDLQRQYGNMADTVAGATQLLAEIQILTKPGLTQEEFDACTERLLKLKADGDAKEKAKKAEAENGGNLPKILAEIQTAKSDYKTNGPRPDMNAAAQKLQGLIKA